MKWIIRTSLVLAILGAVSSCAVTSQERVFQQGEASWYGKDFHGRQTANGEDYNMYHLTAAHRTLPFGSMVKVVSVTSGKAVMVRINDRGPYAKNRIIDVSYASAKVLGIVSSGVDSVKLYVQ